ncbi:MAG TPA: hypothetical protein ENJ90_08990 [Devosia sp.]|nr:hypothetical protein [Devosia sp.]
MTRRRIGWVVFALWGLIYISSILFLVDFGDEGRALARGLSRLSDFVAWQIGAGIVALVVWWFGGAFEKKTFGRWVFRMPALLVLSLVVFVAGAIVWANFQRPSPVEVSATPVPDTTQVVPPVSD